MLTDSCANVVALKLRAKRKAACAQPRLDARAMLAAASRAIRGVGEGGCRIVEARGATRPRDRFERVAPSRKWVLL